MHNHWRPPRGGQHGTGGGEGAKRCGTMQPLKFSLFMAVIAVGIAVVFIKPGKCQNVLVKMFCL